MALDATSAEFIQLLQDARDSVSHAAATAADAEATAADLIATQQALTDAIAQVQAATAQADLSEEEKLNAEAWKLTAQSYAIEPEDVEVKVYTSNGDGTFTPTTQVGVYSALHHRNKVTLFDASTKVPLDGAIPMTGDLQTTGVVVDGEKVSAMNFKNLFVDGAFDVWQQGTTRSSVSWSGEYISGLSYARSNGAAHTVEKVAGIDNFKNAAKISGAVGSTFVEVGKIVFPDEAASLVGKDATMSLKVYSDQIINVEVRLHIPLTSSGVYSLNDTGAETGAVFLVKQTVQLQIGWNDLSITANTISADVGTLGLVGSIRLDGLVSGFITTTGWQLEQGTKKTSYEFLPVAINHIRSEEVYETSWTPANYKVESNYTGAVYFKEHAGTYDYPSRICTVKFRTKKKERSTLTLLRVIINSPENISNSFFTMRSLTAAANLATNVFDKSEDGFTVGYNAPYTVGAGDIMAFHWEASTRYEISQNI